MMSAIYDVLYDLKCELEQGQQIKVEMVNGEVHRIHFNDKISCINGILFIHREQKCIVILKYVTSFWVASDGIL